MVSHSNCNTTRHRTPETLMNVMTGSPDIYIGGFKSLDIWMIQDRRIYRIYLSSLAFRTMHFIVYTSILHISNNLCIPPSLNLQLLLHSSPNVDLTGGGLWCDSPVPVHVLGHICMLGPKLEQVSWSWCLDLRSRGTQFSIFLIVGLSKIDLCIFCPRLSSHLILYFWHWWYNRFVFF